MPLSSNSPLFVLVLRLQIKAEKDRLMVLQTALNVCIEMNSGVLFTFQTEGRKHASFREHGQHEPSTES